MVLPGSESGQKGLWGHVSYEKPAAPARARRPCALRGRHCARALEGLRPSKPSRCWYWSRSTWSQLDGGYPSLCAEIFVSHSFRCVLVQGGVLHYPGAVRALTLSARACRQTLTLPPLLGVPNHRTHALVGHLGPNNDRVMHNPRAYPKRGRWGEPYM